MCCVISSKNGHTKAGLKDKVTMGFSFFKINLNI